MAGQKGIAESAVAYSNYVKFNKEMKNPYSTPSERRLFAKNVTRKIAEAIERGYIPGSEYSHVKFTEGKESRKRDLIGEVLKDLLWYVYAEDCRKQGPTSHIPRESIIWGHESKAYWLYHVKSIDELIDSGIFDKL